MRLTNSRFLLIVSFILIVVSNVLMRFKFCTFTGSSLVTEFPYFLYGFMLFVLGVTLASSSFDRNPLSFIGKRRILGASIAMLTFVVFWLGIGLFVNVLSGGGMAISLSVVISGNLLWGDRLYVSGLREPPFSIGLTILTIAIFMIVGNLKKD